MNFVNWGVSPNKNPNDNRHIVIGNRISLTFVVLALLLIGVALMYFGLILTVYVGLFILPFFFLSLVLNKLGFTYLSRIYLITIANFLIIAASVADKFDVPGVLEELQYYHLRLILLAITVFPFVLFSLSEHAGWIYGLGLNLLFIIFFDPIHVAFGVGFYQMGFTSPNYYFFNYVTLLVFGIIVASSYYLKNSYEITESENKKLIKRLELHQNEILLTNEELLSLNIEKNNLIGVVAHDLKSPLNQIKGLITVIKLSPCSIDKETTGYIQMIENSASRLTNMIGKILDVQAIDSKQLNLQFEPVNFSEMVQSIVDRFAIEAQRKQIQLHSFISNNVIVNVDLSYTDQIIENLISNAIKFSPADKNIYISISTKDNAALCEIRDEGPGLSEDDKKKLFGKYQRLSATPTGNESSTGLGLSIVKRFVDAMRGEIWCESEEGNGASFFVKFELAT